MFFRSLCDTCLSWMPFSPFERQSVSPTQRLYLFIWNWDASQHFLSILKALQGWWKRGQDFWKVLKQVAIIRKSYPQLTKLEYKNKIRIIRPFAQLWTFLLRTLSWNGWALGLGQGRLWPSFSFPDFHNWSRSFIFYWSAQSPSIQRRKFVPKTLFLKPGSFFNSSLGPALTSEANTFSITSLLSISLYWKLKKIL